MVDHLGERAEPKAGSDGAAPLGQQRPYFTDRARDGGAIYVEPAGQYVVGGAVAEVNQRGQEPVDEDKLVLGTAADSSAAGTRGECRLVPLVPQRADLRYEFGDHL